MNDRNLFRGKRKDNGEWVIGNRIDDGVTGQVFIHAGGNSVNESDKVGEEGCLIFLAYEVDPSTICQCVPCGGSSLDEKPIWTKDIVTDGYYVGVVKFGLYASKHLGFFIEWTNGDNCLDYLRQDFMYWLPKIKVIGNVFDTPINGEYIPISQAPSKTYEAVSSTESVIRKIADGLKENQDNYMEGLVHVPDFVIPISGTRKEIVEQFQKKGEKITPEMVIHCSTEVEAKELFKHLHSLGYTWLSGNAISSDNNFFGNCKEKTCYLIEDCKLIGYGNYDYFKSKNYEITEVSDLIIPERTKTCDGETLINDEREVIHPVVVTYKSMLDGESSTACQCEIYTEDGKWKWFSEKESNMRAVKDDAGNTAIVMDDEEEYLLNTQRCAKCNRSYQYEGDFRFYCNWREDGYCIGDWADCSGYQPKGE